MCTLSLWGHTATHTDAHLHVRLTRESLDSVLVSHTRRQKTTKQPWAPTAVNTLAQQPSDPIPARRLRPPLPYICTLRELNSCPLKRCLWVGGRMAGGGCRGLGVGGWGGWIMHVCVSRCLMDPPHHLLLSPQLLLQRICVFLCSHKAECVWTC